MTASGTARSADARADTAAVVREALAAHADVPGALLPILHAVQDALGHVPGDAVPQIAHALNLSRAEVHGVVTYYHHFRATPPGRHVIQLCRAEACQAHGCRGAAGARRAKQLGCALHATSADGAYTLEPVYCLGLCASSPALLVGDELHARVTPAALRRAGRRTRRRRRMSDHRATCRATRPRWRSAPTASRARIAELRERARHRPGRRAQRLARAVLAGAAGRGRHGRRPHRLRAGRGRRRRRACSTPASCTGGAHPLRHRPDRGASPTWRARSA